MQMLVGSRALKTWFPDFKREPKDTDYIVTAPEEKTPERGIEYFYHPLLANYLESQGGSNITVATPDELYTIKISHAFWVLRNGSWGKHIYDMCFLKRNGASFIPEFYDVLYKTWEEIHGKKRANLNVSADEFFNKNVVRKYDHDSIHRSIAYGDSPMYERILRDNAEVAVSKNKFEALTYEEKCMLLREEVYATALERILIPSDFTESPRRAYSWALMKTITSFSKGWFPLWVVLNYEDVRTPDVDFVERFNNNQEKLILLEDA